MSDLKASKSIDLFHGLLEGLKKISVSQLKTQRVKESEESVSGCPRVSEGVRESRCQEIRNSEESVKNSDSQRSHKNQNKYKSSLL